MIIIDNSEGRPQSKLPKMPNAQYIAGIETYGPDIIISPLDFGFPAKVTPVLMQKHIEAGAILCQLKVGNDLVASITDSRLDVCMEKLQKYAHNSWQRWLLIVGKYERGENDILFVNGRKSGLSYNHYVGALSAWAESGGVHTQLDRIEAIPTWLEKRQVRLVKHLSEPIKMFFRESQGELRRPKQLIGGVALLGAIPGIGPKNAAILIDHFGTAADTLMYLSDLDNVKDEGRPKGIGPKAFESVRKILGMADGQRFFIVEKDWPNKIEWPKKFGPVIAIPHGNKYEETENGFEVTYHSEYEFNAAVFAMQCLLDK